MSNLIIYSAEIAGLAEALRYMDGKGVDLGLKRGLKKVGDGVKTRSSTVIREKYNLKKGDVDAKFTVIANKDQVSIICESRPINLTHFNARQIGSRKGKKVTIRRVGDTIKRSVRGKAGTFGGVTATINRSKPTLLTGAFIAKVKAGNKGAYNIGVFRETSHSSKTQYLDPRNRRKTSQPYTMTNRAKHQRKALINMAMKTVASLFGNKETMAAIDDYLQKDALDIVLHEIEWATREGL